MKTALLHSLCVKGDVEKPQTFPNPFYYTPHPLCRAAMSELVAWLRGEPSAFAEEPVDATFRQEAELGKMFGVLVVEHDGQLGYLAGYSGQLGGRSDWPHFVPAVFDYLQHDGYFKRHEAAIVDINHKISQLENDIAKAQIETDLDADDPRPMMQKGQKETETNEEYIRRRQFENAELHRWKLRHRARTSRQEQAVNALRVRLTGLKQQRRQQSDNLQRWLFSHFVMRNARGEERDLLSIFGSVPPSGSGECCEPRLLQYAFAHGLRPLCMAMMWWGESPRQEIRHQGHYYPACNKRCRPILTWMMQGLSVEPNPLEQPQQEQELKVVYEDSAISVVLKPAGMLSVPGKSRRPSVLSLMRQRHPEAKGPLIVHRLDMATSGLMVVALTEESYRNLQQQFAHHEVKKRYVALLSNDISQSSGEIALPLRPDLNDRPRQVVDHEYGKPALTHYERTAPRRLNLYPQTGRTHQLRMHCAHRDGLDNPILGDPLYGKPANRLYLHAEELTFRHPVTGQSLTFRSPAPF